MSEYVYLKGKASWVKHTKPDRKYVREDGTGGFWDFVLYPDAESLEKVRELQAEGVKNVIKKDEDGYYVRFRRPEYIWQKGKLVEMHPPLVVNIDGSPLGDDLVGNGSDVTAKIEVYKHKTPNGGKAKAARWMSLRVDNLVPYAGRREPDPYQQGVKGLDKVLPTQPAF